MLTGKRKLLMIMKKNSSSAHLSCFLVALIDYDRVQCSAKQRRNHFISFQIHVICKYNVEDRRQKTTDNQSSNICVWCMMEEDYTHLIFSWIEGLQLLLLLITVIVWFWLFHIFFFYLVHRKNDNFQYFFFVVFGWQLKLDCIRFDFMKRPMR